MCVSRWEEDDNEKRCEKREKERLCHLLYFRCPSLNISTDPLFRYPFFIFLNDYLGKYELGVEFTFFCPLQFQQHHFSSIFVHLQQKYEPHLSFYISEHNIRLTLWIAHLSVQKEENNFSPRVFGNPPSEFFGSPNLK